MTKKSFCKPTAVAAGMALALIAGAAQAEQTIGVQTSGPAIATARVNVKVVVPKIVILRVGTADGTPNDVIFNVGLSPAVTGNSQAYTGGIPPTLTTTVTPAGGQLVTGLWTNVGAVAGVSTKLTCSLADIGGGVIPLAAGASAGGAPGTVDITAQGTASLAHPGATLKDCDGTTASTTNITPLTNYSGQFTYGTASTFAANTYYSGTYGKQVTYTATTP